METDSFNLLNILPILSVTIVSLVVLTVESLVKKNEASSFWISVWGLVFSGVITMVTIPWRGVAMSGMITVGGYGSFFAMLFIIAALFTIILSRDYLQKTYKRIGEFYLLILFATIGMMLMAAAADLVVLFLGLELMSICLYVLAGFLRLQSKSNEAALKYFLLGAFATGFLLYGIALVYGASGTTDISFIVANAGTLMSQKIFIAGLGLILIGFAFKVAAVPFHMWVPDVYEGSPTIVSGFMSTGAKAAAFSAFLLMFAHQVFGDGNFMVALSVLAAASMIIGNLVALSQTNIKRMLAYSSIAHAGYMLTGLAAANSLGKMGIIFYLTAYTFMNLGAFGIISILESREGKNLQFEDYAGLGTKKPVLAALMAIFMFSLSGIPPFAGFLGKYYVFAAAVNADLTWLAILGVVTSAIGVYYYLRIVVMMYFKEGTLDSPESVSGLSLALLSIAALLLFELGIFPSTLLAMIERVM
ncbi:MAG: NADH-quinone oxidoreductase subunit N [Bacteroidetes bacterium]|nr:MAG: NADH-quinone oxidoreductase subunit N [Bacteroidota bacterium]